MSQDTRKDPRAKIVSLNVRYKSATVDEFIENHSHDVSRGGLFIKTSTPFAQGTLLKFEIRLSSDQPVIAGVGRVVWKREPNQAASDRPAGMGVKFIKIDDKSRATIERLVTVKADAGAAFVQAQQDDEVTAVRPSAAPRVEVPSEKKTISGMPAVTAESAAAAGSFTASSPSYTNEFPGSLAPVAPPQDLGGGSSGGGNFFPTTGGEQDMPPPQERTMMRQAAELLEEALKASGGSMEEVEQNPLFAGLPKSNPEGVALTPAEPREEQQMATIGGFPTSSPNAAPAVVTPAAAALAASEPSARRSTPPLDRRSTPPPARISDAPPRASMSARPVRATDLLADSAPKKGGGGMIWAGLAVVAIGGGLAYAYQAGMLTEQAKQGPTASTSTVTQTAPPTTAPTNPEPATSASAAPGSAAPIASSSAAPIASASAAAATSVAVTPKPTPEPVAVKTPTRTAAPKPAEKPVEAKTAEATEKTAETKTAETKPAETKPAETTEKTAAKPAEKPVEAKPEGDTPPPEKPKKPAAKPAAKPKDDSDNPY